MKVLYFDIDGVLLDYEDNPRPLLAGGILQHALQRLEFDMLVCVSGWSDIANSFRRPLSELEQKEFIHNLLKDIFVNKEWFLARLSLVYDTDKRCSHINLHEDWWYIDDWADKFFGQQFGEEQYQKELGNRILLVNPHGDGSDILLWLEHISQEDNRL